MVSTGEIIGCALLRIGAKAAWGVVVVQGLSVTKWGVEAAWDSYACGITSVTKVHGHPCLFSGIETIGRRLRTFMS